MTMALSPELAYLMDSLSCVTYNGAQHSSIFIEENDCSAKLKKIKIQANNGDWFCFSPDRGTKCRNLDQKSNLVVMSPLLKIDAQFDHHCACDAVIFFRKDEELTVIYIDLKSGNPTKYQKQFQSTRQFVRYLISLHGEFTGKTIEINKERYIIFYGGDGIFINKKTTVPKPNKASTPSHAYKKAVKNGETIYLKELLA